MDQAKRKDFFIFNHNLYLHGAYLLGGNNKHLVKHARQRIPLRFTKKKFAFQKPILQNEPPELQNPIEIPGAKQIMSPKSALLTKIFWFSMILTFFGVCLFQLVDRISHYMQTPITVEAIITKQSEISLPTITSCYSIFQTEIFRYQIQLMRKILENSGVESTDVAVRTMKFSSLNMSLENAWSIDIKSRLIMNFVAPPVLLKNNSFDDEEVLSWKDPVFLRQKIEIRRTNLGPCITFSAIKTKEILYKGPHTYVEIYASQKRNALPIPSNINFYLHRPDEMNVYDAALISSTFVWQTRKIMRIAIQEFKYLNRKYAPCANKFALECQEKCFDRKLEEHLKCRLPYMNLSKPMCDTIDEWENTEKTVRQYGLQIESNCSCPRKCRRVIYSYTEKLTQLPKSEIVYLNDKKKDGGRIKLSYPGSTIEVIQEKFSYTFSSLISDVGGSLGFFIGCCALSLVEIIETLIYQIHSKFKSRKRT